MWFFRFHVITVCVIFACFLKYTKSSKVYQIALRADRKSNLYWSIDYHKKTVEFEVHVPLKPNRWFAIGFSDHGELKPADYCVLWTDWFKNLHFQDTWTSTNGQILVDKKQDCLNFLYILNNDGIKFTFSRKFDTCDPYDYVIEDGTTHVVWAEGNGPLFQINGLDISSALSSGFERAQLLKNENVEDTQPWDTWTLEILADHVQVPNVETTYWCHVYKLPDSLSKKQHIIKYEPVIQEGSEHLVHHMEVFHCEADENEIIPDYVGSCSDKNRPEKTTVCKRVLAAWAMGAQAFSYPQEAGLPIGGPKFNRFVMLEVHYNNPDLLSGLVDSSGIRFHLTPTLRKYDAGVMELGLEYTDKMAIPPKQSSFVLKSFCISECTKVGLPKRGIVVFGSQLHTHLIGVKVYTKHFRNGVELRELNRDNHYSSHFQEIRKLKHSVRVLPGDDLITACTYNSKNRNNITFGGLSITDEMCVNYIHYYPKTDLEVCKSSISYKDLFAYFVTRKVLDNANTDYMKGISDNYYAIDWTPDQASILWHTYEHSTISMQCNMSSGERFPGEWEGVFPTKIYKPLKLPKKCHNL